MQQVVEEEMLQQLQLEMHSSKQEMLQRLASDSQEPARLLMQLSSKCRHQLTSCLQALEMMTYTLC